MATHSNMLAWKILWTEELGELQSMGSQKAGHGSFKRKTYQVEALVCFLVRNTISQIPLRTMDIYKDREFAKLKNSIPSFVFNSTK